MSKKTSMAPGRGAGLAAVIVRRKTISDGRIGLKFLLVCLTKPQSAFWSSIRYLGKESTLDLWVK